MPVNFDLTQPHPGLAEDDVLKFFKSSDAANKQEQTARRRIKNDDTLTSNHSGESSPRVSTVRMRHQEAIIPKHLQIWHVSVVNLFVLGLSVLLSLVAAIPLVLYSLNDFRVPGTVDVVESDILSLWGWLGYAYCFGFQLHFMIFESKDR